jgi:hypothetical protein
MEYIKASAGAELRDQFAAAALTGLLSCRPVDEGAVDVVKTSYAMADAMLAEREKGGDRPANILDVIDKLRREIEGDLEHGCADPEAKDAYRRFLDIISGKKDKG